MKYRRFGPIQTTDFGELPRRLRRRPIGGAIEWLRSHELDYLVSVPLDRPGTHEAEWRLRARDYERGPSIRRYVRQISPCLDCDLSPVEIREIDSLETEGMGHVVVESFELPGLASVLHLGLPDRPGWHWLLRQP